MIFLITSRAHFTSTGVAAEPYHIVEAVVYEAGMMFELWSGAVYLWTDAIFTGIDVAGMVT